MDQVIKKTKNIPTDIELVNAEALIQKYEMAVEKIKELEKRVDKLYRGSQEDEEKKGIAATLEKIANLPE